MFNGLLDDTKTQCTVKKIGTMLEFRAGETLVARYLFDKSLPKPHFHPLMDTDEKSLTRAYPMQKNVAGETTDHPHHRGCWIGHQDVLFEPPSGEKIEANFWADLDAKRVVGKQVCVSVEDPVQGKDHVKVVTRNEWRAKDTVLLNETRTITLYNRGEGAKLFVLEVDLHSPHGSITFGDEKDGFMALRVADWMAEKSKKGGVLENAEGKTGMQRVANNTDKFGCWGLQSGWVDYSAPKGEGHVGITVMDDPKNTSKAYWHARDYGLLTANPFGGPKSNFPDARDRKEMVKLEKDAHLKLRYGVLIHKGTAKTGNVAEQYKFFSGQ